MYYRIFSVYIIVVLTCNNLLLYASSGTSVSEQKAQNTIESALNQEDQANIPTSSDQILTTTDPSSIQVSNNEVWPTDPSDNTQNLTESITTEPKTDVNNTQDKTDITTVTENSVDDTATPKQDESIQEDSNQTQVFDITDKQKITTESSITIADKKRQHKILFDVLVDSEIWYVRLRQDADTSSIILQQINNWTALKVHNIHNNFYQVEYKGVFGRVSADYVIQPWSNNQDNAAWLEKETTTIAPKWSFVQDELWWLVVKHISSFDFYTNDPWEYFCSQIARSNLQKITWLPSQLWIGTHNTIAKWNAINLIGIWLKYQAFKIFGYPQRQKLVDYLNQQEEYSVYDMYAYHNNLVTEDQSIRWHRFVVFRGEDDKRYALDPILTHHSLQAMPIERYLDRYQSLQSTFYLAHQGYLPDTTMPMVNYGRRIVIHTSEEWKNIVWSGVWYSGGVYTWLNQKEIMRKWTRWSLKIPAQTLWTTASSWWIENFEIIASGGMVQIGLSGQTIIFSQTLQMMIPMYWSPQAQIVAIQWDTYNSNIISTQQSPCHQGEVQQPSSLYQIHHNRSAIYLCQTTNLQIVPTHHSSIMLDEVNIINPLHQWLALGDNDHDGFINITDNTPLLKI